MKEDTGLSISKTPFLKEKQVIQPEREVPVREETDVLVIGGGPAGVMAAIAAKRAGVGVVLVERYGYFGGLFTGGQVIEICGVYVRGQNGEPYKVCRGIGEEFMERTRSLGGMLVEDLSREDVLEPTVDPEAAKYVLDQMLQEAGVQLLLHCWGVEAIKVGNTVHGVVFESKSGRQAILAKVVIDTTGDGDIFASAGAEFSINRKNIGLVHRLGNMDRVPREKLIAAKEKNLSIGKETPIPSVRWVNMAGPEANCVDINDLTRLELEHRKTIWEKVSALKQNPGFEEVFLLDTAAQLGVRVSRLLKGVYQLTLDEALAGTNFSDVIGIAGADNLKKIGPIPMPYGILVPEKLDNLLTAGRSVSVEFRLINDIRVVPTCFTTGQAAGVAAAIAVTDGCKVREVNIPKLQRFLKEQGAYLG